MGEPGWATRQSAEPIPRRQWLSFNAQRQAIISINKIEPHKLHDK